MNTETYSKGKLIERRDAVGTKWIIKNAEGVKIGEEPLTPEEVARFQNEGQPSREEKLKVDITAASSIAGIRDAILAWLGD